MSSSDLAVKEGMAIAKALAEGQKRPAFSWERAITAQGTAASRMSLANNALGLGLAVLAGPSASSPEVDAFLNTTMVDPDAALRFRQMPPQLQRQVIDRGPIAGTRNPSSVLISRIRDAEMGRVGQGMPASQPSASCDPAIEKLIKDHKLDDRVAGVLRALPPDQRAAVMNIPINEARNPSAFLMTQLQQLRMISANAAQPRDSVGSMLVPFRS